MAAGLRDTKYETNSGLIASIRLSALDKAVAGNGIPAGVNSGLRVYNARSGRKLGIQPRRIRLKRVLRLGVEAQGIPDQYAYRYVTILTKAAFEAFAQDQVVIYDGEDYIVDLFQPEKNNG
jgi:hypothetical protein